MDSDKCITGCLGELKDEMARWGFVDNQLTLAAANGNLDAMRLARAAGYPWDCVLINAAGEAALWRPRGRAVRDNSRMCAAGNGHIACLKWAEQNGCDFEDVAIVSHVAAHNGHLDVLVWLWLHGHVLLPGLCGAALYGCAVRLDMLEWLLDRGVELERGAVENAVYLGYPDVVRWYMDRRPLQEALELAPDNYCFRILGLDAHGIPPTDYYGGFPYVQRYPARQRLYREVLRCLWQAGASYGREHDAKWTAEEEAERKAAVAGLVGGVFEKAVRVASADCIKRKWREAIACPDFSLCRERLRREFSDITRVP